MKSIVTLLSFAFGLIVAPANVAGMSEAEFLVKMEAHVLRVVRIGRHLLNSPEFLQEFPEFAGLDKEQVLEYLARHDAGKIRQDRKTLRNYNLPGRREGTIAQRLGDLEGQNFNQLPGARQIEAKEVVSRLNRADSKIGYKYLRSQNLITQSGVVTKKAKLFLAFEKAVDTSDRYFEGIQDFRLTGNSEFGKQMKPGSEYLQDRKAAKIASFIENPTKFNYTESTRGLSFRTYQAMKHMTGDSIDRFLMKEGRLSKPPLPLNTRMSRFPGWKVRLDSGSQPWAKRFAKGAKGALKGGPLLGLSAAVGVATAPRDEKADAIVESVFGASSAHAGTPLGNLIHQPDGIDAFFLLPLDEQQDLRKKDSYADKILAKLSPQIRTLKCNPGSTLIELKDDPWKGRRWVELARDKKGHIVRVTNWYENPERNPGFNIFLNTKGEIRDLRFWRKGTLFHQFPVSDLQHGQRRIEWEIKVTPQRMVHAEQVMKLYSVQKEAIDGCCANKKCQDNLFAIDKRLEIKLQPGNPGTTTTGTKD